MIKTIKKRDGRITGFDINKISKIDISNKCKYEINKFLDEYYDRYTGLYLKSKSFIKMIYE